MQVFTCLIYIHRLTGMALRNRHSVSIHGLNVHVCLYTCIRPQSHISTPAHVHVFTHMHTHKMIHTCTHVNPFSYRTSAQNTYVHMHIVVRYKTDTQQLRVIQICTHAPEIHSCRPRADMYTSQRLLTNTHTVY